MKNYSTSFIFIIIISNILFDTKVSVAMLTTIKHYFTAKKSNNAFENNEDFNNPELTKQRLDNLVYKPWPNFLINKQPMETCRSKDNTLEHLQKSIKPFIISKENYLKLQARATRCHIPLIHYKDKDSHTKKPITLLDEEEKQQRERNGAPIERIKITEGNLATLLPHIGGAASVQQCYPPTLVYGDGLKLGGWHFSNIRALNSKNIIYKNNVGYLPYALLYFHKDYLFLIDNLLIVSCANETPSIRFNIIEDLKYGGMYNFVKDPYYKPIIAFCAQNQDHEEKVKRYGEMYKQHSTENNIPTLKALAAQSIITTSRSTYDSKWLTSQDHKIPQDLKDYLHIKHLKDIRYLEYIRQNPWLYDEYAQYLRWKNRSR